MKRQVQILIVSILTGIAIVFVYNKLHAEPSYHTCTELNASGKSSISANDPLYNKSQDLDQDGRSCEL